MGRSSPTSFAGCNSINRSSSRHEHPSAALVPDTTERPTLGRSLLLIRTFMIARREPEGG
jgi:hypothetical protein